MRAELIKPDRFARVGIAREDAGGKFVIARAILGVPRAGIGGAVIDQVEFRVVGNPSPDATAADFPCVGQARS